MPFDPFGLLDGLKRDLDRLYQGLEESANAFLEAGESLAEELRELDQALPEPLLGPRGGPATQILLLELHRQGLPPREMATKMEVTPVTVYRILREEGLRPNPTPETEGVMEIREEGVRLHQEGVSGREIARRLGISDPTVVAILRPFRPMPGPRQSREFEERAFVLLPRWRVCEGTRGGEHPSHQDRPGEPGRGGSGLRLRPPGVPQTRDGGGALAGGLRTPATDENPGGYGDLPRLSGAAAGSPCDRLAKPGRAGTPMHRPGGVIAAGVLPADPPSVRNPGPLPRIASLHR